MKYIIILIAFVLIFLIGNNRCDNLYNQLDNMETEISQERLEIEKTYFKLQCNKRFYLFKK